jgi:hypothetical protein
MAYKTKLRLTGRPSREPGGIIIDQFEIISIASDTAPQKRKHPKVNAMMADAAEPPAPDVPTEAEPIPTESPVGELDVTPIPTESPLGEVESVEPTPVDPPVE